MTGRVDTAEGRRLLDGYQYAAEVGEPWQVAECRAAWDRWREYNADALLAAAEELDSCRRDLAEERARTTQLTEALSGAAKEMQRARGKLPVFSMTGVTTGVTASILYDAEYRIARVLDERGAGTEQPA